MGSFVSCVDEEDVSTLHPDAAGRSVMPLQSRRVMRMTNQGGGSSGTLSLAQLQSQHYQQQLHMQQMQQMAQEQQQIQTRRNSGSHHLDPSLLTHPSAAAAALLTHHIDVHANARICMESTPNGKEKNTFKFYCPICFMHFKEIYKSVCCGNYVCVPCALAHITQRLSLSSPPLRIPSGPLHSVCCPSCNSEHVQLVPVQLSALLGEKPRSYMESPHTRDCLAEIEGRNNRNNQLGTTAEGAETSNGEDKENTQLNGASTAVVRNSSFHQLKQKILDFESAAAEENSVREKSVSRTTNSTLPPRRPLASHHSQNSVTATNQRLSAHNNSQLQQLQQGEDKNATTDSVPFITPFQSISTHHNPLLSAPLNLPLALSFPPLSAATEQRDLSVTAGGAGEHELEEAPLPVNIIPLATHMQQPIQAM